MSTVKDAVGRPIRSGLQGGVGWVLTEAIDAFLWDMDDRQYGVSVIILGAVASFIQNTYEDHIGKGLLRKVPAPDAPIPDPGG